MTGSQALSATVTVAQSPLPVALSASGSATVAAQEPPLGSVRRATMPVPPVPMAQWSWQQLLAPSSSTQPEAHSTQLPPVVMPLKCAHQGWLRGSPRAKGCKCKDVPVIKWPLMRWRGRRAQGYHRHRRQPEYQRG